MRHPLWKISLGITVAFIATIWFATAVPLEGKIALSVIGSAAGVTLAIFFVFFDRYEQRLGFYLAVDRDGVHLRHGLQVPLEDFAAFEVTRRWEPTGEGETPVAYLVLRTKGGEEVEILASVWAREVFELRQVLDENIRRILAAKSGIQSSAE